jgi:CheY-like chemotaxis protein
MPTVLHAETDGKQLANNNRRRAVLVVDDEYAVRDVLQILLQHAGFQVWTAASGEEALDRCCDHSDEIAVILLDIRMPGLDGPRTLDGIRALDANIPVCFMSGSPGDYERCELLRQGARHLFGKPLPLDEIVRVVRDLANEPLRQLQEN